MNGSNNFGFAAPFSSSSNVDQFPIPSSTHTANSNGTTSNSSLLGTNPLNGLLNGPNLSNGHAQHRLSNGSNLSSLTNLSSTLNSSNASMANPLNATMSNADVSTILGLQQKTEHFHRHLSSFINNHLPQLPDTMELMDRLQYDFSSSNLDQPNAANSSASSSSRQRNGSLPSLETDQKESADHEMSDRSSRSCQQCASLTSEVRRLRQENLDLRRQLAAASQRTSLMENQLMGTRHIAIHGVGPRMNALEFVKFEKPADADNDELHIKAKRTKGVDALKRSVRARYDTSKWKCEGDEELFPLFDAILSFLNENEEDVVAPFVLIGGENEESAPLPQSSVVEKYTIVESARCPSLKGQFGLRAKCRIPAATVLGQYTGVEYLEEEFHEIYAGANEALARKNIYAFTLSVTNRPSTRAESVGGTGAEEAHRIVVDALAFDRDENGNKPLLIYINDCRRDISQTGKSGEDEQAENVHFAKVSLNGWPSIFVVTKRDIMAGEQILGFYGNDYFQALKQFQTAQELQRRTQSVIDNGIRNTLGEDMARDGGSKRVNLT